MPTLEGLDFVFLMEGGISLVLLCDVEVAGALRWGPNKMKDVDIAWKGCTNRGQLVLLSNSL